MIGNNEIYDSISDIDLKYLSQLDWSGNSDEIKMFDNLSKSLCKNNEIVKTMRKSLIERYFDTMTNKLNQEEKLLIKRIIIESPGGITFTSRRRKLLTNEKNVINYDEKSDILNYSPLKKTELTIKGTLDINKEIQSPLLDRRINHKTWRILSFIRNRAIKNIRKLRIKIYFEGDSNYLQPQ